MLLFAALIPILGSQETVGAFWPVIPAGDHQTMTVPPEAKSALRVIPISRPGVSGCSFAVVTTDAEEADVAKKAAEQGLLAGPAMPTQPNPQFWSFIDQIKKH
jgi:hypothetical protein